MDRETGGEILSATERALCEHGYANLTMQRIADEAGMTTAAIHYHFDTKQELLNAFLADLIERFEGHLDCEAAEPSARLDAFLDAIFVPTREGSGDFSIALMELKSQAPFQEPYRKRLLELDERMRETIANAVADGVESGEFEPAAPAQVAHFVVTMVNGSHVREVALGEDPTAVRALIESYLDQQLGWTPEGAT